MSKTILDEYLQNNGITRYSLSKISGIPTSTLLDINKRPLNNFTINILKGIATAVGKRSWQVLRDLEELEMERDPLLGFRAFLEQHQCYFPDLEQEMHAIINELEENNARLAHFSFNRFESEEHDNLRADARVAMENAIQTLREFLYEIKKDNER